MGGHALNKVQTRRYNTDEYDALCLKMRMHLVNLLNTQLSYVRAFRKKESHGDLDVLVSNDGSLGDMHQKIVNYFKPGQIVCNGNVYSFDYEEFQVDLIFTTPENWETSLAFFDYDPSGNLMGKIAHKFGLKYGFSGLTYPYRGIHGTQIADITISKDNRKIFEFLGFDYDRYLTGFDTKQEIFDYVINSKYFDPQNFLMENLNHVDRMRNRKRPTYQEFLTYINVQVEAGRKWNQNFNKNKEVYLSVIDSAFPEANVYGKIAECQKQEERRLVIAEKFNATIIMRKYPDITGVVLGDFIIKFKQHIAETQRGIHLDGTDENLFGDYVYNCSEELIIEDLETFYSLYKKM